MQRRAATTAAAIALGLVAAGTATPPHARAEDFRTAVKFVEGLRERGYFDTAAEYLEGLRKAADLPDDLRPVVDYELARNQIATAATSGDLVRRRDLLDQARARLDAFTKAYPSHTLASEALVQLSRLLVERGHLALIQGDEEKAPADKQARVAEARAAFAQARTAYDAAIAALKPALAAFPVNLGEDDPRRAERDRVHVALMNAELQRAVVDYEDGITYDDPASPERQKRLADAQAAFVRLYNDYRRQEAGFYARMWQAKCFEEAGKLGEAMGIYDELMKHQEASLRPLQRQVGYFRILVHAKRNEHALAADDAVRWLQANPNDRRTSDGLGVTLQLAKSILAQMPGIEKDSDRQAALKRATDALAEVVRVYSPHKAEALALLRQHKPKTALSLNAVANLSYEAAMAEAEDAVAGQEWDRALVLLKAAVRKADPARDPEKANRARYLMAYAANQAGRYYEAAVLAEHVARRYPQNGLAPRAAEIAIKSLLAAYNAITAGDRTTDLDRMVALATYTSQTWPDSEQGDFGKFVVGEVALGRGQYGTAVEAFESVRTGAPGWADAQNRAGVAHWKRAAGLRAQEPPATAEADEATAKAVAALQAALKARVDAGAATINPERIGNACDLADVLLETGKAADALALLAPYAEALAAPDRPAALAPLVGRVLSTALRGHVAAGEVDKALADMKALEAAGGAGAGQAQLYFKLGRLLESELAALRKKNDARGVARLQDSYLKFLTALADSKAGQSYESLQWAGEAMLAIGRAKEAAAVFDRVLATYEADEAFKGRTGSRDLLLRTKLRRAAALRGMKDFDRAGREVEALLKAEPRLIEPRLERGHLLEARAEAGKGTWDAAIAEWRKLATQLGTAKPRKAEYYEAWYHVAHGYWRANQADKARQTLAAVLRLSPTVGGPEMKAKYQEMLARIDAGAKRTAAKTPR